MFIQNPTNKLLKYVNGLTIKSIEIVNVGFWDRTYVTKEVKGLFGKKREEGSWESGDFIDKYAIRINYHNGEPTDIPDEYDYDEEWQFFGEEGKKKAEKEIKKLVTKLNKINQILIEEN